ncbi:MAG: glycoside hydrolase family 2 [Clostridiaceae bacterium]|nr:glycoside hydrolase family 2 [Clostridiaceae bacterium]
MKTIWGEKLNKSSVLTEYPRPQMVRESYMNLNGIWSYAITDSERPPDSFDEEILVPFSPECELSGVMRKVAPEQTLWYQRRLELPAGFNVGRVLLHFGAIDQIATVYVNGTEACKHVGGYTPFSADITPYLSEENTILVKVRDFSDTSYHSRGKQKSMRGGIWYTSQSGIWQTVWLESVPREYINALRITPLFDEKALEVTVLAEGSHSCSALCEIAGENRISFQSNEPVKLYLQSFIPWTPENPHLYDLTITMGDDLVKSYFGMRKFSVQADSDGIKRLFLNNKPYFHTGLLDQGYYSDGMYTAPSDEAMIFDIQTAKDMGFNMLRKHIKIEPLRWYYHCDRIGMLVWQDMINGGGDYRLATVSSPLVTGIHFKDNHYKWFARDDAQGRQQYYRELEEMIAHLYNCVSIAMWVPFNEGWGQFDAKEAVRRIAKLDSSRTIDHASGWHDQFIGDFKSIHIYFKRYRFKSDKLGRAVILSEFGGYNYRVAGHSFNEQDFGYKRFETAEELLTAYRELYKNEVLPAKKQGLCAAVYTQLTDVEDELNGLITYDRKVLKLPSDKIRQINEELIRS